MQIVAYLNEPAKYTVRLTEEVYQKLEIQFYYDLRKTQHNNKDFDYPYLREMTWLNRWKLYYKNWKKSDLVVSNGYLFDWFVITFVLNLISFKWKPIAIESDTPYLKSDSIRQYLGKLLKGFYFRFPFVYGFGAGTVLHRDYFTKNGMSPERVFLMPWVSVNYNFKNEIKKHSPFIFIFVGRFLALKRIETIIAEFLLNFEHNPSVLLKLVGDGPLFKELKSKYNNDNIEFCGKLFDEDLEDIFRNSHCLILASTSEMWGLVVNEALSAGMPVLLSKFVGSRYDLVDGKDTGIIFDPLKWGDLANAMKTISSDHDLYRKYSTNAHHLMHHHWNYQFYSECFKKAISIIQSRHSK